MSINVTVTGNPISISRGKMVTCDSRSDLNPCSKDEYEKRRLMRLEQVRQQSKDIAEDVRNKVRKEKKKQMGEIEREGKEKLKNWQNRKLLDLQNQYQEAVREIGIGHKQGQAAQEEIERVEEQALVQEEIAKTRGREAASKAQIERNERNFQKAKPIQHKKLARDIENSRSALIAKTPKKTILNKKFQPKKKKTRADINITIPESSDTENEEPQSSAFQAIPEEIISEEEEASESNSAEQSTVSSKSEEPREPLKSLDNYTSPAIRIPTYTESFINLKNAAPVDTRISERIHRRGLIASQPDYCDVANEDPPEAKVGQNLGGSTALRNHILQRPSYHEMELDSVHSKESFEEIPIKPPVKLKQTSINFKHRSVNPKQNYVNPKQNIVNPNKDPNPIDASGSNVSKTSKVQYYDHSTKFSKVKHIPTNSYVEKITNTSIEVIPNLVTETELYQKSLQQDRDAEIRGRKALEKEQVHRNYNELLKKLPLLQKKERICEINSDKPEYHMSEDRLKEQERKKQNRMDNAYAKNFPPKLITLPKVNAKKEEVVDVGSWEADFPSSKLFTAEEVQKMLTAFGSKKPHEDRKEKLKELLRSLNMQKKQLIDEIQALPKDETLNQLIHELDSFDESKPSKPVVQPKVQQSSSSTSTTTTSSNEVKESRKNERERKKSSSSPRKKKKRRDVLVLQNMSTQTTPKPLVKSSSSEDKELQTSLGASPSKICHKLHTPCDCYTTNEELCQIIIKINEDDPSEVVVKPHNKEEVIFKKPQRKIAKEVEAKPSTVVELPPPPKIDILDKPEKPKEKRKKAPKVPEKIEKPKEKRKDFVTPIDKPIRTKSHTSTSRSWKEEFNKNASNSTTSTSYFSPPNFSKPSDSSSVPELPCRNLNALEGRRIDPRLLTYIKKLLSMSRASIDDLTVSSVSEVPTPNQSVINIDSNNPMSKLQNIMKYFNLRVDDIAKELSYSDTSTNVTRLTVSPGTESDLNPKKEDNESGKASVASQYAGITDNCTKRIANLSAMIQKLRDDKMRILQSSISSSPDSSAKSNGKDNLVDHSTAYMELPEIEEISPKSAPSSLDEEEMQKKLEHIDLSLANRLRKFPKADGETKTEEDSAQDEFVQRLQKLMQSNKPVVEEKPEEEVEEQPEDQPEDPTEDQLEQQQQEEFIPFLMNIPKLPKLIAEELPIHGVQAFGKRPPPSKGLSTARRFNGNISLVPHELSTIVEADSQVSTRVDQSNLPDPDDVDFVMTNDNFTTHKSSVSDDSTPNSLILVVPGIERSANFTDPNDSKASNRNSSSSSSDDVEAVVAMLRGIGMEWAIPTMYKMQSALALSSSSSSLDLSNRPKFKKTQTDISTVSEVSLRDFLKRQMLSRVSSSTLKSDASPASSLEFSDLSGIQGNSSLDKSKQRTSTPIQSNKSKSTTSKSAQKNICFTGDSDISSVKDNVSQKSTDKFFSLSEQSSSRQDNL